MTESCVLYGAHASYYTARVRSYLRKKGLPFVERLPSHPRFREHVRPASGSHRIPQLELPDGQVLQDSTVIIDALEARYPEPPALPPGPTQRVAARLTEVLGCDGLVLLAWRYRWLFPDNLHFVKMDFGRSFRPQGSDEELLRYGEIIAERMLSRGDAVPTPELLMAMEQSFARLLRALEAHLTHWPYLLGCHPSVADHALMGALYAHLGRDPVPLHFLQRHAPRVFRWVEHMNTPEVSSPEWPELAAAYPEDDVLPETFLDVLRVLVDQHAERFRLQALAYNEHVRDHAPPPGAAVSEDEDQPSLPARAVVVAGETHSVAAAVHHVWLLQRVLAEYHGLDAAQQASCRARLTRVGAGPLLDLRIERPPQRRGNRFHFG